MTNLPTRPRLTGSLQEGIQRPMPAHVSILGNRFTLVDGAGQKAPVETFDPKLGPYLDCVIADVNAKVSRIFYENDFDPESPGAPDCFSDNGVAPSVNATNKQAPRCDICPRAEWGSAVSKLTGKGVPACRSYKKMAIFIPGFGDMLFMLAIPPASLKAAQAYSQKVDSNKVDLTDVVTRISFQPGVLGTLVFDAIVYADAEMKARVDKVWERGGAPQIVGRDDKPAQIEHKPMTQETVQQHIEQSPSRPTGFGAQETTSQFQTGNLKGETPAKKPRGRPRTVQEAPKNALQQAPQQAPTQRPFGSSTSTFPQATTSSPSPGPEQGKFGVVENPPAADPAVSATLDSLFSTKFE